MPNAAVESFRSSSLRYERGHSGSASFAPRSRGARRRSRSASRRCKGGARCAGNRATGVAAPDAALVTVAALHHAHLGIQRRPPDSVERAAPSKCCAFKQAERPGPSGKRARNFRQRSSFGACAEARLSLDICKEYSYVASRRARLVTSEVPSRGLDHVSLLSPGFETSSQPPCRSEAWLDAQRVGEQPERIGPVPSA